MRHPIKLPNSMGCLMEFLYENEFHNPQIFQQTISLFPEQSTLETVLNSSLALRLNIPSTLCYFGLLRFKKVANVDSLHHHDHYRLWIHMEIIRLLQQERSAAKTVLVKYKTCPQITPLTQIMKICGEPSERPLNFGQEAMKHLYFM
jgi:hypothetical protein